MKLFNHGVPIADTSLVAVDAVSMLSGVNFGSVVKVFAAIQLVTNELGLRMDQVVRAEDMPVQPCKFDGSTTSREQETALFAELILKSPINPHLKEYLNLRRRLASRQAM